MPEEPATDPAASTPTPGSGWRDADLKRAIAAAEEAGLLHYRVDIAMDGTISIIVGDSAD